MGFVSHLWVVFCEMINYAMCYWGFCFMFLSAFVFLCQYDISKRPTSAFLSLTCISKLEKNNVWDGEREDNLRGHHIFRGMKKKKSISAFFVFFYFYFYRVFSNHYYLCIDKYLCYVWYNERRKESDRNILKFKSIF